MTAEVLKSDSEAAATPNHDPNHSGIQSITDDVGVWEFPSCTGVTTIWSHLSPKTLPLLDFHLKPRVQTHSFFNSMVLLEILNYFLELTHQEIHTEI